MKCKQTICSEVGRASACGLADECKSFIIKPTARGVVSAKQEQVEESQNGTRYDWGLYMIKDGLAASWPEKKRDRPVAWTILRDCSRMTRVQLCTATKRAATNLFQPPLSWWKFHPHLAYGKSSKLMKPLPPPPCIISIIRWSVWSGATNRKIVGLF